MVAQQQASGFVDLAPAPPAYAEHWRQHPVVDLNDHPLIPLARLAETNKVGHIADLRGERGYIERDPVFVTLVEDAQARTMLLVPMLKESELVGAIVIYRQEVRPFSDNQIELVTNFAAQAVIAIENTRLLNELRQRTNDLSESLEQQTATSEVLRVISSSQGELDRVFQAMLANALRICEAKFGHMFLYEGNEFRAVATRDLPHGWAEFLGNHKIPAHPDVPLGRAAATKQAVHVEDARQDPAYIPRFPALVAAVELGGARTLLVNPRILMLDDATSAVDAQREFEIHGALRTLMRGRTTLIIAHRLSTISLADRVVVLEGGRIVADGRHDDLMRDVPLYREILAHAEEEYEREHEQVEDEVEEEARRRRIAQLARGASDGNGSGPDGQNLPQIPGGLA